MSIGRVPFWMLAVMVAAFALTPILSVRAGDGCAGSCDACCSVMSVVDGVSAQKEAAPSRAVCCSHSSDESSSDDQRQNDDSQDRDGPCSCPVSCCVSGKTMVADHPMASGESFVSVSVPLLLSEENVRSFDSGLTLIRPPRA